jgi:hypothetical protein
MTKYTLFNFPIITEKRPDDWRAHLEHDRRVWETGNTEACAIGKLVIRLNNSARDAVKYAQSAAKGQGDD